MFKNYLKTQPWGVQLPIFVAFWSLLQIVFQFTIPIMVDRVAGIRPANLSIFIENDVYKYPRLLLGLTFLSSVTQFLLPAAIFLYLSDPHPFAYVGLRKVTRTAQIFLVLILAVCLIFFADALSTWIKQINFGAFANTLQEQRDKMLEQYINSTSITQLCVNVFLIALTPAICEEFFFRGVVQRFAYTIFKKWWVAIGFTAFMFALFHASFFEFLPIFVAGCLLGWVYYITSNLWLSILLHFVNNGLQIVLFYMAKSSPTLSHFGEGTLEQIILFSISLIIGVICIYMLAKVRIALPNNWSVVAKTKEERVG